MVIIIVSWLQSKQNLEVKSHRILRHPSGKCIRGWLRILYMGMSFATCGAHLTPHPLRISPHLTLKPKKKRKRKERKGKEKRPRTPPISPLVHLLPKPPQPVVEQSTAKARLKCHFEDLQEVIKHPSAKRSYNWRIYTRIWRLGHLQCGPKPPPIPLHVKASVVASGLVHKRITWVSMFSGMAAAEQATIISNGLVCVCVCLEFRAA